MVYRTWRFSTPIDDPYKKTRQTAGLFVSGAQWDSTYGARNSNLVAFSLLQQINLPRRASGGRIGACYGAGR